MYKVFIENRPIIICEKNKSHFDSITLFSHQINSIREDVFPLFKQYPLKTPIVILAKGVDEEFKRLFTGYSQIEAAGGIVRRKEKFLFIKRFGKWDIPKGKLEKKESPEIGAIREIEEECGITGPKMEQFICHTYHTYLDKYKGKNKLTLKKTYWYAMTYDGDEELKPQVEEGITKAKWIKRSKLDKVRFNTYESILDVIDTYFDDVELILPKKKK